MAVNDIESDISDLPSIHIASWIGNINVLKEILKFRGEVNATDKYQRTPLHLAAAQGFRHIVIALLENGADVNVIDCHRNTPISKAVEGGHNEIVKLLLKKETDLTIKNENGDTALHIAIRNKFKDIAFNLIEKMQFVNIANDQGKTPLHLASSLGMIDIIEVLLYRDTQLNSEINGSKTSLAMSSQNGHLNILKLLQKSADEGSHDSEIKYDMNKENNIFESISETKENRNKIYQTFIQEASINSEDFNYEDDVEKIQKELAKENINIEILYDPLDKLIDDNIIEISQIVNGILKFANRLDPIRNIMNRSQINKENYKYILQSLKVKLVKEQNCRERIEKIKQNLESKVFSLKGMLKFNCSKIQKLHLEADMLKKRMEEEKETQNNIENYTNKLKQRDVTLLIKNMENELDFIKNYNKKLEMENYSLLNQRDFYNIEINSKTNEIEEWEKRLAIANKDKLKLQMQIDILHKELILKSKDLKHNLYSNEKNLVELNLEKGSLEKKLNIEISRRLTVEKTLIINNQELQDWNIKYENVKREINQIQKVLEKQSRYHCQSEQELRSKAEYLRRDNQNLYKSINELRLALQRTEFQLEKENSEINRIFSDIQENLELKDMISNNNIDRSQLSLEKYSEFNDEKLKSEDGVNTKVERFNGRKLFHYLSRKSKSKSLTAVNHD